jgi:hypothetical protein
MALPEITYTSPALVTQTILGFIFFHSFEAFIIFNIFSAIDPSFWMSAWISLVTEKVSQSGRQQL